MDIINYSALDYEKEMIEYMGDERIKNIKGKMLFIPAEPDKGFNFGYSLFIPEGCKMDGTLFLHGCNTGGCKAVNGKLSRQEKTSTLEEGEEAAKLGACVFNEAIWDGFDLKMPVITPLIPRISGYYTHALGSMVYNNDVSYLREFNKRRPDNERLTEEQIKEVQEKCYDLPTQVVNMIEDAKDLLTNFDINVDSKVIVEGYSAGSMFANYFTALHPEMVKACISGGNLGLVIMPVNEIEGQELKFPLGTADVPDFDLEEFMRIPQFYYTGDIDYNDPAEINEEAKKRGEFTPRHLDCYTPEETKIIHKILGDDSQVRFDNVQKVYNHFGINALFKKFPGNHNSIIGLKDSNGNQVIHENVMFFLKYVLKKEKEITEESVLK